MPLTEFYLDGFDFQLLHEAEQAGKLRPDNFPPRKTGTQVGRGTTASGGKVVATEKYPLAALITLIVQAPDCPVPDGIEKSICVGSWFDC